jgi:pilus assembly protein Flp/PilA
MPGPDRGAGKTPSRRRIRTAGAALSHLQQSDFGRFSKSEIQWVVRALRRALRHVAIAADILKEAGMVYLARIVNMFRRDEDGQDLLEYALLVALIAIVAVASVTAAGGKVSAIFTSIVSKLP